LYNRANYLHNCSTQSLDFNWELRGASAEIINIYFARAAQMCVRKGMIFTHSPKKILLFSIFSNERETTRKRRERTKEMMTSFHSDYTSWGWKNFSFIHHSDYFDENYSAQPYVLLTSSWDGENDDELWKNLLQYRETNYRMCDSNIFECGAPIRTGCENLWRAAATYEIFASSLLMGCRKLFFANDLLGCAKMF
jgi:hypothetical protein